jgi:hypothetical protein
MRVKRLIDLVADDSGQDLVEYALTTGAITGASLVTAALIMLYARNLYFNATGDPSTGVQAVWEPCAPGGCS